MAKTVADVVKMAKDVKMVDFRFTDLPGIWQHFSIPARQLNEELFEDGIGFDGSSIRGFQEIHESDMLLMPDPDTAFIDPMLRGADPGASSATSTTRSRASPTRRDPRYVAQQGRSLPEADRHCRHQLLGAGSRVLHLQRRALRRRHQLVLLLHRQRGRLVEQRQGPEAEPRRPDRAQARLLPRAARPTRSRTCAARSCWRWRAPACRSRSTTTRWPPPARPRSTCASTR